MFLGKEAGEYIFQREQPAKKAPLNPKKALLNRKYALLNDSKIPKIPKIPKKGAA